MATEGMDYRRYLRNELESRAKKNPRYSLRNFSKALGLSHPTLSRVLRGERGISTSKAYEIAERLKWDHEKSRAFVTLVELESSPPLRRRQDLLQELHKQIPGLDPAGELQLESFRVISDWYHFAILQLIRNPKFKAEPKVLSKVLGITKIEAENAIQRLLRLELIVEVPGSKHQYHRTQVQFHHHSDEIRASLKAFSLQWLRKIEDSLIGDERTKTEATTLLIRPEDHPKLVERISEFLNSLSRGFLNQNESQLKNCTELVHVQAFAFQVATIKDSV